MVNGAKVIFRRIRGRIIPFYQKHQTAADVAAAAGTYVGASVVAEKSRNKLSEKLYYKGRKGFNSGLANFVWDAGITVGLTYAASRKFAPVARGIGTITKFLKKTSGGIL